MTQHSLSLPTLALASKTHPDALPTNLPDEATSWQAVQRRDRGYNGRFWFSVRTTGVYCLPSCAARPPLRRNVDFHASPDAAEAAGFRACKRCKPREWQADVGLSKPVARACKLFDSTNGDTPPSLAEVARSVGLTAGALSKRFIAELGVNPRDWLATRKRQRFRKALREGEAVADALYGAGYGSPSRVYETVRAMSTAQPRPQPNSAARSEPGGVPGRLRRLFADGLASATHVARQQIVVMCAPPTRGGALGKLIAELRRRNVIRVAGVYAVVGWLVAQVATLLETSLGLPAWFDAVIVAAKSSRG